MLIRITDGQRTVGEFDTDDLPEENLWFVGIEDGKETPAHFSLFLSKRHYGKNNEVTVLPEPYVTLGRTVNSCWEEDQDFLLRASEREDTWSDITNDDKVKATCDRCGWTETRSAFPEAEVAYAHHLIEAHGVRAPKQRWRTLPVGDDEEATYFPSREERDAWAQQRANDAGQPVVIEMWSEYHPMDPLNLGWASDGVLRPATTDAR